ncbi:MAG TPA: T9SS type A sorting domain-containing protein [Cytophagales bacterium]|nr:T9SS type A sorting domain-containing protein [Cytophagales bacterium]
MKTLILAFAFLGLINSVFGGEIFVSGVYQGKNLYVQNPFSPDKKQFCTDEVFVNDIRVLSEIKHSAFTINLSHLQKGAEVEIKITYKNDCAPKIVNAFVLQKPGQHYTFNPVTIQNNAIYWSLKESVIAGRFIIEKYTDNFWKPIATTPVNIETTKYHQNLESYFSAGTNKFRVKYMSPEEKVYISSNISHESEGEAITFLLTSSNKILLSKESPYEIIDADGNKIKDGRSNEIQISHLNPGIYYINYSNKSEKFLKK